MIGTGAHESILWGKGSSIHDYVVEIRIARPSNYADAYTKVEILNEQNKMILIQLKYHLV
jgi:L-gulonolactone oxidase